MERLFFHGVIHFIDKGKQIHTENVCLYSLLDLRQMYTKPFKKI